MGKAFLFLVFLIPFVTNSMGAQAGSFMVMPSFSLQLGTLSSNDGAFATRKMFLMKPELAAGYKFWRFLFVGARADVAWVEQLSSKELDGQSNLLGSAWSAGAIVGLVFTRIHLLAHFDPLGRYYPSNPTVQTQSLSFENPQAYGVSARYHFTDSFFLGTEYFKTTYRRIRVRSGDAPEGESSYSADTQIRFWSAGITFGATL